eukprot:gene10500-16350_t
MTAHGLNVGACASAVPLALLLFVGISTQGAESLTLEETDEWKICVAIPSGCFSIDLKNRGLTGSIPASIGQFTNLQIVFLNGNAITGEIPSSIGQMKNLQNLWLYGNKLSGPIPNEIGYCVKLQNLWLNDNRLSGPIPGEVGNLRQLTLLYLYGNALSGQIPDNLKGCSNLREMKLQNNELSGPIPGNAVWGAMKWSLTTLYLQGNKLTGSVPPFLFELAIYSDAPFSSLNLGENQLSGDLPIKHTMQGKTYKLANKFAELWLLGNNWEGGPCAALCGANTGKLDDVKRTTSKDYATKCLENTDSHVNLLESEYTIDELGRCSLKSPTCTAGYFFEPSRTIVEPDCKRCPLNTYQAQSDHTNPACVDQPTCGVGEKIVGVVSAVEARSCELCTSGKYQDVSDHRLATCSDQPKCNAGQKIDEPSTEQRRKCSACELGKFQDDAKHTRQSCKPQMPCNPGEEFDISPTKPRECKPCSDNEYQDSTDEDAFVLRCIAQPVCMSGQYISEDSKTARRKCNACPGGQYQEKQDHRELQCKLHELCPAGTEFENTYTEERRCTACGPNTYQDKDKDKDALQTFCFDQPTCQPGEEMSRDTTTARRKCSACLPGYYQDETGHRETLCKKQPTCSEGTQYEDSVIKKRVCSKCDPNQYQVIRGTVAECIDQPFCRAGQYMSPDSATKLRKCETCKGDTYQDKTQHRQEKCKQQPVCDPGYAFTTSDRQKRTCEPIVSECGPGSYYNPNPETPDNEEDADENAIAADIDGCYPCSPGQYANGTERRVQCDQCPPSKTSEPASTSEEECFAKFESAAASQSFCFVGINIFVLAGSKQDVDKEPAKNADEPATFCSKLTIFFSTQTKIETPMNIIHIYIMVCISLLEDLPQMAFAGTYVTTMNNAGLDLDGVAVFSMFLSTISVVFSIATVGLHISAHRASKKKGWWKVKVLNIHELVTLDSRKDQKSARRKSVGSYSELTCDADRDAFINSKIKVVVTSPKLRESLNNNSTMLKTFRKSLSGVHYFPNLEDDQRSKLSTREQLEGKTRQTNPLYSVEANTGSEVQIDLTAINPQYGVEANTGSEEQIDSIYPQDVYDGFDSFALF